MPSATKSKPTINRGVVFTPVNGRLVGVVATGTMTGGWAGGTAGDGGITVGGVGEGGITLGGAGGTKVVMVVDVVGTGGPVVVVVGGGAVVVVVVEQLHGWAPVPHVVPDVPSDPFIPAAGWVESAGCTAASRWITVAVEPSVALHAAPPRVTLNTISPMTEASMTMSRFTVTLSLPLDRIRSRCS
jgi:hypothetical protein